MITQQYILPRDVAWNRFSLANVLPKLSQDVYLGKGSGGSLDEVQMVKQKPNEEPSEFLGRVCKAYWQYRYR